MFYKINPSVTDFEYCNKNMPRNTKSKKQTKRLKQKEKRRTKGQKCIICLTRKSDASLRCTTCNACIICDECYRDYLNSVTVHQITFANDFLFSCPTCRKFNEIPTHMHTVTMKQTFLRYAVAEIARG